MCTHGRRQQCDEYRDDYQSEWSNPNHDASGGDGACGPACRRVTASRACRRSRDSIAASRAGSSRPRGRARTGAPAVGRAEGRHASDPIPAGRRRAAERARLSGDTTAASTGPAIARDERATAAVGRHSIEADNAFRGNRAEQPISGAIASTRGKGGGANVAVGRDTADDALIRACRRCQAWNTAVADAGCNNALSRDRAGDVNTIASRTDQAQSAAITDAGRKAVDTNAIGCGQPSCAIRGAWRQRQASNPSTANAGRKAFNADNAFSRDHTGRTIASRQAASAPGKTDDAAAAIGALKADHRGAVDPTTSRA
jgi:hypothetical protein